jgi:hypothetical protein
MRSGSYGIPRVVKVHGGQLRFRIDLGFQLLGVQLRSKIVKDLWRIRGI